MQLPEKHRPEKQRGEGRALLLELQLCSLSPRAPGQPCTPRLSRSARPRQAEPGSSQPWASEALPSWGFTSPWGADPFCWEDPGTKHFGSDSGEREGEGRNKKIPVDAVLLPTAAGLLQLSTIVAPCAGSCAGGAPAVCWGFLLLGALEPSAVAPVSLGVKGSLAQLGYRSLLCGTGACCSPSFPDGDRRPGALDSGHHTFLVAKRWRAELSSPLWMLWSQFSG